MNVGTILKTYIFYKKTAVLGNFFEKLGNVLFQHLVTLVLIFPKRKNEGNQDRGSNELKAFLNSHLSIKGMEDTGGSSHWVSFSPLNGVKGALGVASQCT